MHTHRVKRIGFVLLGCGMLLGCSSRSEEHGAPSQSSSVKAPLAQAPSASPPSPAASAAAAPSEPESPAVQVVESDGIRIVELANGQVTLKTTTLWNNPIDTRYQSCDFYRSAVPVIARQIDKSRAQLLDRVCTKASKAGKADKGGKTDKGGHAGGTHAPP